MCIYNHKEICSNIYQSYKINFYLRPMLGHSLSQEYYILLTFSFILQFLQKVCSEVNSTHRIHLFFLCFSSLKHKLQIYFLKFKFPCYGQRQEDLKCLISQGLKIQAIMVCWIYYFCRLKSMGFQQLMTKLHIMVFMVLIVLVSHLQQFSILNIIAQSSLCFLKKNLQTSCALFYFCFKLIS